MWGASNPGGPAAPEAPHKNEQAEVAALKKMFARKAKPPWDDTPLRNRPSALIGLKPVTREPWAIDEDVYNRKFETRDVGMPDRYLDVTARARMLVDQSVDALNSFNMKYCVDTATQGGILGGDPVRAPPPPSSGMQKKSPSKPALVVQKPPDAPAATTTTPSNPRGSMPTVTRSPQTRGGSRLPQRPGPSPHAWPHKPQSWIPDSALAK